MTICKLMILTAIFASHYLEGNESNVITDLKFVDNVPLDDIIANQNSTDAPNASRRLQALHFFRQTTQPTKPLPGWQDYLTKLVWYNETCVSYVDRRPGTGKETHTLIAIDVLSETGDDTHTYIFLGFDASAKNESAFHFISKSSAKITYLGLMHQSGFIENYLADQFWVSYLHLNKKIGAASAK